MGNSEQFNEPPLKEFNETIAHHGFALPQAILQAAELARGESEHPRSKWRIEPIEFPVSVHGQDSRIDLLFRDEESNPSIVIGECKRTNPEYSEWCFCPYRRTGPSHNDQLIAQRIHRPRLYRREIQATIAPISLQRSEVCHLGLVVPGKKATGRQAETRPQQQIEDACAQVCRGLSGLTNTLAQMPTLLDGKELITIFPVVFTTARLWVGKPDLWRADLTTGNPPPADELEQVDWLCYQYPMSPGLMHDVRLGKEPESLPEYVASKSLRTIVVVHAARAKEFFQWFSPKM